MLILSVGSPAEGFVYQLDEHRMITNVDARENAQASYNHSLIKYKCHDIDNGNEIGTPPAFTIMAQSHKETKADRWLKDYLGTVSYHSEKFLNEHIGKTL